MSEEEPEAVESTEVEVATYSLTNPDLLEAMIEVTELLDRVAKGEISSSEARALYAKSILPKLKELEAKHAPKPVQKKEKPKASGKKEDKAKGKSEKKLVKKGKAKKKAKPKKKASE